NHVDRSEPWVHAIVGAQVDVGDRSCGDGPGSVFAHQREHAAVVVGVGVDVEQVAAGGGRDGGYRMFVPAFADVDHALEHVASFAEQRGAEVGPRSARCGR